MALLSTDGIRLPRRQLGRAGRLPDGRLVIFFQVYVQLDSSDLD